jgi:hypothetical protein
MQQEPHDLFGHPPSLPGYDQLKEIRSGSTGGNWRARFDDRDGESLLVLGIGEPGTRLYQALTPPLGGFYKQMVSDRSPRPMLMSRRSARATRFAHLIHAFRGTPGVRQIEPVPGGYRIDHAAGVDEVFADVRNRWYGMIRHSGGKILALAAYGMSEMTWGKDTLFRSPHVLASLRCRWQGDTLSISADEPLVRLAVRSPATRVLNVNGRPLPFRREGEMVVLRSATGPVLDWAGRGADTLHPGMNGQLTVRVFNPTGDTLRGPVTLMLESDWAERVRSQREDWGGVTNLLPLHKNATERLLSPQILDPSWIEGKSSPAVTIGPGEEKAVQIPLSLPAAVARAGYPVTIGFAGVSRRREIQVAPPVSARITIPHGPGSRLRIDLAHHGDQAARCEVAVTLPAGMMSRGALRRTISLGPRGTGGYEIPFALEEVAPANQHYPVKLRVALGGFTEETVREFFIARGTYARQAPSLDGSWRGWEKGRPVTIDTLAQVSKLLLGNQPWNGVNDLSATLRVLFDETYLYVGAAVRDDSVTTTWDFPAMSYPWDTDCMEVVLDTRTGADQATDPPTPGLKRHLSMPEYRRTLFGPERWQGAGAGGPLLPRPLIVAGAETFYARSDAGYALICRYPLHELGLRGGKGPITIGFDAAVNDNDGTTYRKNTHIWSGYTRNQTWWDMGTIGVLILEPASKAR